jgi:hypothetical protein
MGWLVLCGAIEQGESLAVCQSKPAHDLLTMFTYPRSPTTGGVWRLDSKA